MKRKLNCTCGGIKKNLRTSQSVEQHYEAVKACPVHGKVPDKDTKRYEKLPKILGQRPKKLKGWTYLPTYGVMQAVALKNVGIKAFFSAEMFKCVAVFPTKEDARAYLLAVLDTVKREQKLGIRTKRNLDPKFEGGLDFQIVPMYMLIPDAPLLARGWDLGRVKKITKESLRQWITGG